MDNYNKILGGNQTRVSKKHPYGYGNAEYIVSVFTSILILGATIFIMGDSIKVIFKGEHVPPHWAALGAAIISVFANLRLVNHHAVTHRKIHHHYI